MQFGGDEVVQAKDGAGSATLSMAYAAKRFVEAVLAGLLGQTVQESAYIYLDGEVHGAGTVKQQVGCDFFAVPVTFGKQGIEEVLGLGDLSKYEMQLLEKAKSELLGSISKGVEFVTTSKM